MNIYDKLQEIVAAQNSQLSKDWFSNEDRKMLDTDFDTQCFDLLKSISSLSLNVSDITAPFSHSSVVNGKRTFALEDLAEDDYKLLETLDLSKVPLNLRARILDIMWIQKKDYSAAISAVKSYFELYSLWIDDNWSEALDMIKRAISISARLNKKDLQEKCCQSLYDKLIKIDGKDKSYLPIHLIEILLDPPFGDFNKMVDILNAIITHSNDDFYKTERAYLLKTKLLYKLKKADLAKQSNLDLADYLVKYAEKILKNGMSGIYLASDFFEKAIQLYRNNGDSQKAKSTHRRLVEVQQNIPGQMQPITYEYDTKKFIDNIARNMENLSFEESIIWLTQMTEFCKKDDFKKNVIDELTDNPSDYFMNSSIINCDGQTVASLPGLDITDPEKDPSLLDKHIQRKMYEFQTSFGNKYLRYAFTYIAKHYNIDKENIDFLINDNLIIPSGRENVIRSAIIMALKGQYYEALHILAPQTENIFRNIAKEVGGLTVTIDNEGISESKLLTSVFELPELKECYDNDILFLFSGLLNRKEGANIRNEIAHGIMNERSAGSGSCLYFICAFLKLLVWSSRRCIEMINEKKELQTFKS